MKINVRNTALGLLEGMDPFSFRICEDGDHSPQQYKTKFGLSVVENWPTIVDFFKKKIQYISDPFHEAYLKSVKKLASVIDAEEINESGTLISRASPSETNTIFYWMASEGKGADFVISCIIFFFTKETDKDKPSLAMYIQRNAKAAREYLSEGAVNNGVTSTTVMADIFTLILFMKYCEIETKIVGPKSKVVHANCKYVNETANKIEILDSTWFTTLIKSDEFKVRGHFRLQAVGEGRSQKRLIWVTDFKKTGYTRKAKVLGTRSEMKKENL